MRVLLPLACVALLVAASGALADLTPLPESEWGSVVGGATCGGSWIDNSRCEDDPDPAEAPCDQDDDSCTTSVPDQFPFKPLPGQPEAAEYKISVNGYLVCSSGGTQSTWQCCQETVNCASTLRYYTATGQCPSAESGHAYSYGLYKATGCTMMRRK